MRQQLLLIEDVEDLGRSGDLVKVKAGFARNYLLPQKKGIIADKNTIRMQDRLQKERQKKAEIELKKAAEVEKKLEAITLKKYVKIDPEGNMYGSVSVQDISDLLKEEGIELSKKSIRITKPIKETGTHPIPLKLQEGVDAKVILKIIPEGVIEAEVDEVIVKSIEDQAKADPTDEDLSSPKQKWTDQEKKEVKDATKKI